MKTFVIYTAVIFHQFTFCYREVVTEHAVGCGSEPGEIGSRTNGILRTQPPTHPLSPPLSPLCTAH